MAVWLVARRDFAFKGTPYTAGDVFHVPPLVAVQMTALRAVSFAKAPPPLPDPTPMPVRRKRTYTTKQMVAEHPNQVAIEPEAVPLPSDDDLPHDDE